MKAPIVVGVDGSTGAARALAWALAEAQRLDAPVRVVHAWWSPPEYTEMGLMASAGEDDQARQTAGEQLVARMLEDAGASAAGVEVTTEVVNDHPATTLIDRSATADRLVMGTRGLGGFAALVLGAVTQQVVQHARCPVVVIPPVD